MFVLVKKELRNFFSSAAGFVIIAVFLTLTGSFLWLMPSDYNILDGGYANLDGLFLLSPWLFMFLIPALTMKMFADETASGTMELLLTKPLGMMQIVMSKFIAGWMLSVVALVPTLLYMVSVGMLGVTPFNLDLGGFWGSFIGLVLLSASYTAIGVFCSSLSRNSIVSFTLSALLSFLAYYGFEALSDLVSNAEAAHHLASLGIASHYDSMSRGVLALTDVLYFVFLVALFIALTVTVISGKSVKVWIVAAACALLYECSYFFTLRLDLTQEKRYTLSDNTKNLMRSVGEPISVEIYLSGDMNRGFLRLKDAVLNMVKEMNAYSDGKLLVKLTDPSEAASAAEREKNYASLNGRGLKPTMVYDRDAKGGMIQKVVFPWAVMSAHSDTVNVCLLENIAGKSGDENLNASVEALEYKITDAIRRIMNKNPESVAFLEGHGELSEPYVYSVTERLSAYYNVDRGVLGKDASVLDRYKVVIVAGPVEKFSEADKYIVDQYIMRGGRVLWLIDGVRTDKESMGIANELALEDMLFTYGVRISPLLLLDTQCAVVPVNVALDGESAKFEPMPWYYSPLLLPNPSCVITRNIPAVRADFASVIELVGENNTGLSATALLFSSGRAGLDKAPMQIDASVVTLSPESEFFSFSYLPVSVLLEGKFNSVFANRMVPPQIDKGTAEKRKESVGTKMIFVADGDVVRNDIKAENDSYTTYPAGYDQYSGQTFGNEEFILNAVNYLADDEGWLQLRGREWKIRLLDKNAVLKHRVTVQIANIVAPLVLLITFCFVYQIVRKKRWSAPLKS